jgi:hypothetical protein
MHDDIDIDILSNFQNVPHKGLARMIPTLDTLGVYTVDRKWRSRGDAQFPRVEYLLEDSAYRLSMGVSRQPFRGHISWIALHGLNENGEASQTLRLCFREEENRWLREWTRGLYIDPKIDPLVKAWFPKLEAEIALPFEGLIDATLQHMVSVLLEG